MASIFGSSPSLFNSTNRRKTSGGQLLGNITKPGVVGNPQGPITGNPTPLGLNRIKAGAGVQDVIQNLNTFRGATQTRDNATALSNLGGRSALSPDVSRGLLDLSRQPLSGGAQTTLDQLLATGGRVDVSGVTSPAQAAARRQLDEAFAAIGQRAAAGGKAESAARIFAEGREGGRIAENLGLFLAQQQIGADENAQNRRLSALNPALEASGLSANILSNLGNLNIADRQAAIEALVNAGNLNLGAGQLDLNAALGAGGLGIDLLRTPEDLAFTGGIGGSGIRGGGLAGASPLSGGPSRGGAFDMSRFNQDLTPLQIPGFFENETLGRSAAQTLDPGNRVARTGSDFRNLGNFLNFLGPNNVAQNIGIAGQGFAGIQGNVGKALAEATAPRFVPVSSAATGADIPDDEDAVSILVHQGERILPKKLVDRIDKSKSKDPLIRAIKALKDKPPDVGPEGQPAAQTGADIISSLLFGSGPNIQDLQRRIGAQVEPDAEPGIIDRILRSLSPIPRGGRSQSPRAARATEVAGRATQRSEQTAGVPKTEGRSSSVGSTPTTGEEAKKAQLEETAAQAPPIPQAIPGPATGTSVPSFTNADLGGGATPLPAGNVTQFGTTTGQRGNFSSIGAIQRTPEQQAEFERREQENLDRIEFLNIESNRLRQRAIQEGAQRRGDVEGAAIAGAAIQQLNAQEAGKRADILQREEIASQERVAQADREAKTQDIAANAIAAIRQEEIAAGSRIEEERIKKEEPLNQLISRMAQDIARLRSAGSTEAADAQEQIMNGLVHEYAMRTGFTKVKTRHWLDFAAKILSLGILGGPLTTEEFVPRQSGPQGPPPTAGTNITPEEFALLEESGALQPGGVFSGSGSGGGF